MAATLSELSIGFYVVAAIALVTAVFLWFYLKIPGVISDLSGRTAKRSIARVRAKNEASGKKSHHSSGANAARVKLTGPVQYPTAEQSTEEIDPTGSAETSLLTENRAQSGGEMPETGLLAENQAQSGTEMPETGLLAANRAAPAAPAEETTLLAEETTLLVDGVETPGKQSASVKERPGKKQLKLLDEVVFIHTDEVIE